jgi:transcriptional regulator with XRE-family HTH domain
MRARPDLDLLPKIVAASDKRLSNGTLDRIRRGASATDIDTLEELAATFGVEPWQLLVEGLNPQALQVLQQVKVLVTAQYPGDTVKVDRMGKPAQKVLPQPSSSGHNGHPEPVFGPALTKLFASGRGPKNERSTAIPSKSKVGTPAKRSGKRSS